MIKVFQLLGKYFAFPQKKIFATIRFFIFSSFIVLVWRFLLQFLSQFGGISKCSYLVMTRVRTLWRFDGKTHCVSAPYGSRDVYVRLRNSKNPFIGKERRKQRTDTKKKVFEGCDKGATLMWGRVWGCMGAEFWRFPLRKGWSSFGVAVTTKILGWELYKRVFRSKYAWDSFPW